MQYLFLFGRSPALSKAEIHRLVEIGLLKGSIVSELSDALLLESPRPDPGLYRRLGGTIRVVELAETVESILPAEHSGKFTFGFSYFHLPEWRSLRQKETAKISEILASRGVKSRFLTSRTEELPTASVRGNSLLRKGAEFIRYRDGEKELIGRTIFVHDIESYTSRDRARPSRDPKVGMLPPKLAQILINLGVTDSTRRIWDPLGGTGVILQEALIDGYAVLGSDAAEEMVGAMRQNLDWIKARFSGMPEATLFRYDIRGGWPAEAAGVDCIVTEGDLGRPLSKEPDSGYVKTLEMELRALYKPLFSSAAEHLPSRSRIVLCLPFFRRGGSILRMGIIDDLRSTTYTLQGIYDYAPHGQTVGRQVTIFEKV